MTISCFWKANWVQLYRVSHQKTIYHQPDSPDWSLTLVPGVRQVKKWKQKKSQAREGIVWSRFEGCGFSQLGSVLFVLPIKLQPGFPLGNESAFSVGKARDPCWGNVDSPANAAAAGFLKGAPEHRAEYQKWLTDRTKSPLSVIKGARRKVCFIATCLKWRREDQEETGGRRRKMRRRKDMDHKPHYILFTGIPLECFPYAKRQKCVGDLFSSGGKRPQRAWKRLVSGICLFSSTWRVGRLCRFINQLALLAISWSEPVWTPKHTCTRLMGSHLCNVKLYILRLQ